MRPVLIGGVELLRALAVAHESIDVLLAGSGPTTTALALLRGGLYTLGASA